MKHRIFQISLLAITALLILGLAPRWGSAQGGGGPEVKWAADIKIPSAQDLGVQKLIAKPLAQKDFVALSNKIVNRVESNANLRKAVNLKVTKSFTNRLAWVDNVDPSNFITQDSNSGDLLFQNQLRRYVGMAKVQVPTQQEAMNKTMKFLEDVNLLPLDFKTNAKLVHAGGLFGQDFQDGVAGEKSQKLVILNYGRELNGIAVQGPGSKLIAQLGDQGQIVSIERKWNSIAPTLGGSVKMYIPTPEPPAKGQLGSAPGTSQLPGTAKEIERRGGILERRTIDTGMLKLRTEYLTDSEVKNQINKDILSDWNTANFVEVNSIDLVYYDRAGNFIQPAYAVALTIHWGEDTLNFLYHVAALRNPPESIYEVVQSTNPLIQQSALPLTSAQLERAGAFD